MDGLQLYFDSKNYLDGLQLFTCEQISDLEKKKNDKPISREKVGKLKILE